MSLGPVEYTGASLVVAAVLCSDAFASHRGRLGDALRLVPGVALIAAAAAARKFELLSSEAGIPGLWADVLLRADVAVAVIWGIAVATLPPFAPGTPVGQFVRGLVAGGFRPAALVDEPRTTAEVAGAILSPVVLLSMWFLPGPLKALLPVLAVAALGGLVFTNRAAFKFQPSASPVERVVIGTTAIALAHLGGVFAQLQNERPTLFFVASAALAAGAFCDPLVAAIAVSRALPIAPAWASWAPLIAGGLWLGRAVYLLARAALSRRQ